MRSYAAWLLASCVLVGSGCAARTRGGEPVAPATVAPLSRAMLDVSGGGLAQSDAIDRLFDAPEVTAAGERLWLRLGQEPTLTPLYERFLASLMEHPALLQSLAAMVAAAPDTSADELTTQAIARLSAGLDGPAFDAALDGSLDRLLDRPIVDAAFGRMAEALVEKARFSERLAALMLRWQPELEAAVGVSMSDARFTERFEQHLAVPARAGALRQLITDRMVDDPGVRASLAALLDDEAFSRACVTLVRTMLEVPAFRDDVTVLVVGMIEQVDAGELGRRVDRVLVTPAIEAAVVTWVDDVTAAQAFGALSDRLGLVLEDPNLQAELLAIVVGAPAHRTAKRRDIQERWSA